MTRAERRPLPPVKKIQLLVSLQPLCPFSVALIVDLLLILQDTAPLPSRPVPVPLELPRSAKRGCLQAAALTSAAKTVNPARAGLALTHMHVSRAAADSMCAPHAVHPQQAPRGPQAGCAVAGPPCFPPERGGDSPQPKAVGTDEAAGVKSPRVEDPPASAASATPDWTRDRVSPVTR